MQQHYYLLADSIQGVSEVTRQTLVSVPEIK